MRRVLGRDIDGGLGWRVGMLCGFGFPESLEFGVRLWISVRVSFVLCLPFRWIALDM